MATGTNCFFRRFVANAADKYVLPGFCVFLQNEVRVIRNLAHLHDKAEDICVIVQHDTTAYIRIKLPRRVSHDAPREITFNLSKEFVMENDTGITLVLLSVHLCQEVTNRFGGSSIEAV